MSINQSQYYKAKVMLVALAQAHRTLEQATRQQAELNKLKFYESSLVTASKNGQIKITDHAVVKTQGFQSSQIYQLSKFVTGYSATRLKDLSKVTNASGAISILEKAIN